MKKLIGALAAAVLAMSTLTVAATGHGAMGKAGEEERAKANKSVKAKAARDQRRDVPYDIKAYKRHLKADEKELTWYRSNLKTAEKSGDSRRARRYRTNIARLEREIRVQKAMIQDHDRRSKTASRGIRNAWWPWWRT
jgi:hypothetical protein